MSTAHGHASAPERDGRRGGSPAEDRPVVAEATQRQPYGREPVRILTANVQHGSPERTRRQASWLVGVPHDVLVLTEVAAGASGSLMADLLVDAGYHVVLPAPGNDRYRVLVAARGATMRDLPGAGLDVMPHRCVAVRVDMARGPLGVVGLYVPSRGPQHRRNVDKRAFQAAVAGALPMMARPNGLDGPVIVTGDLNVVEPAHDPHYPVFGDWEYEFYGAFAAAGFCDAFRLCHPEGMDYSWFGRRRGDDTRNGYRFDHTFVTAAHASGVRSCRYLHDLRDEGLSDHSAMTVELDP